MKTIEALLWAGIALVAYAYLGQGILFWIIARIKNRKR